MIVKSLGAGFALSLLIAAPQSALAQRHGSLKADRIEKEYKKDKKKNAILGIGLGVLGGAVLSGGDPWATIGGAAVGGVIASATTKDKRSQRYWQAQRQDRGVPFIERERIDNRNRYDRRRR